MGQNLQNPPVHMLSACEALTDNQILQICLILNAVKCIKDDEVLTYYFFLDQ
jgi:hypothetical protein